MICIKPRCWSPVACAGFGHCRERHFQIPPLCACGAELAPPHWRCGRCERPRQPRIAEVTG